MGLDLSRELLHGCPASQIQLVTRRVGVPDSDNSLKVMVKSIRRMPVLLHREVSKPAQWVNGELVVGAASSIRSDGRRSVSG